MLAPAQVVPVGCSMRYSGTPDAIHPVYGLLRTEWAALLQSCASSSAVLLGSTILLHILSACSEQRCSRTASVWLLLLQLGSESIAAYVPATATMAAGEHSRFGRHG